MPLFEFRCASCGSRFEEIVTADRKPACPECGASEVEKLFSAFAVGKGGGSPKRSAASPSPAPT